jgi:hypothetical protein
MLVVLCRDWAAVVSASCRGWFSGLSDRLFRVCRRLAPLCGFA